MVSTWNRVKQNLKRERLLFLSNVFVMTITFLLLGVFITVVVLTQSFVKNLEQQAQVTLFFKDDFPENKIIELKDKLVTDDRVLDIKYISKNDAFNLFKEINKDEPVLLESISPEILPASLEVRAKNINDLTPLSEEYKSFDGVEEIKFFKDVIDRFRYWSSVIYLGGLALVLIFFTISYSVVLVTLTYCYTINTLPSSVTCTFTAPGISALSSGPFANQPGVNTLYISAKDEVDNINYDAYDSVSFTANTSSPGVPLNVEIADVSVKETESWKLALSWEHPTTGHTGVTYEIYHSTDDASYTFAAEVSGIAHIDTGLEQTTHYYKVRACDSTNNCGVFTAPVSTYPDGRYTTAATLTSGPTVTAITTKQATISWVTDRTSDSKIQYGEGSGDFFDEEPSNSDQLTDHTITLTNLSPGTRYYFQAKWTDEDGNTGTSEETTFETEPAPTVSDPKAIAVNLTTATIRYTVTGASKVRIYYGETQTFGATMEISTSTVESTYNTILEDLKDGTKYFYKINGFDSEGAEYEGSALTFETLPRPKISEVKIQQVRGTAQPTVLISWVTNTETSSIVTYFPTSDPSQTRDEVNVDFVLGEHRILIRGLQPETPYSLIVKGRDKNGNEALSDTQRLTTATDTRAPAISDLVVEGTDIPNPNGGTEASSSQLVISWTTDEPATSQIEYGEGTGTSYPQRSQEDKSMVTNHAVVISGLVPSRVYHFRVISRDKANNPGISVDTVTITPKASDNALDLVINNLSQIFGFLKKQ